MSIPVAGRYLNKRDYLAGMDCERKLWLHKNDPAKAKPHSEGVLNRMRVGRLVGDLARQLHPSGVLIEGESYSPEAQVAATEAAIASGAECLFEATFIHEGLLTRVDILRKIDGRWWIEEVKSGTLKSADDLTKDKLFELAFQLHIVRSAGLDVAGVFYTALDRRYRWRGGEHHLERLLGSIDVTTEAERLIPAIAESAAGLLSVMSADWRPDVETNTHCRDCEFHDHCNDGQHKWDVVFLPGVNRRKVRELRAAGFPTIDLIPADHDLTPRMKSVWRAITSGSPYVGEGLASALGAIRFPAAFIDFEACQPAIPIYRDTAPYASICFQWSAHLLSSPDRVSGHKEFLAAGNEDPRGEFCRTLLEVLKKCETVVFYSEFEHTQVRSLANQGIAYAEWVVQLLDEKGVDLHAIVRDHVYLEDFKGRTSLKTVLPALVPELTYEGLTIGDGDAAMTAFQRIVSRECSQEETAQIRSDLLSYCKRDTEALVAVYRVLMRLAAESRAPAASFSEA